MRSRPHRGIRCLPPSPDSFRFFAHTPESLERNRSSVLPSLKPAPGPPASSVKGLPLRSDKRKRRALDSADGQAPRPARKGICFLCAAFCGASEKQKTKPTKGVFPMQQLSKQPAFELGQIVATPGALAALKKAGQQP